jgi:predicted CXXCH cytochrome family protein
MKRTKYLALFFIPITALAIAADWDGLQNPAGAPRPGPIIGYNKGVVGGPHDLSEVFGPGGACNGCHVPHVQAVRTATGPATQPAVEMFRVGGQRRVFQPGRYMPGPTSLLCLGCHDGTIAMSTMGTSHALLAGVREGFAVPDSFVWRDHPIGVLYPVGRRDYRPRSFVEKAGIRLPEGRVECISCHDPHNTRDIEHLLVMSNRRSALCLTCHIK